MLVAAGVLCSAQTAFAATLTVDDDKADCPAAGFTSVQAAVDAAADGDTIVICAGEYVEGNGQPGTNAVTIQKNNLTLKGAGAHLVSISPKASGLNFGNIMEAQPELRNGIGDIIAIVGTPTKPLTAHISGVTVDGYDPDGRPVAVEAGIAFVDAKGSVKRSHVTNVVTSEGDNAYTLPGGWRGPQPGIGIVQTSRAMLAPVDGSRRLEIDRVRVDKYNRVGILIDGAQNDFSPFAASGAVNWGVITSSSIVGRTVCVNYAGTGTCVNAAQVTTGPLFGQDGLRVTAGGYATVDSSLITQNLVHGEGAPVRSTTTPASTQNPTPVFTPNSTNNANLPKGAGVRYAGARLTSYTTATGRVIDSWVTRSNIVDNSYGAINETATGTPNAGNPNPAANAGYGNLLKAEHNWWGVRNIGTGTTTPAPEINPAYNPPVPENPVNGVSAPDEIAGQTTSNAVDYYPYRNGVQSDPASGAWPIMQAPLPVADNAPTAGLTAPASANRGTAITLTATGSDDFGVKRVRFADGTTTLGTVTLPPYTLQATIPADAACGSARTYTAVVMDSLGQTKSASATVNVTCTTPGPDPDPDPPAAPTIAFDDYSPRFTAGTNLVELNPTAAAGIRRVDVFLGDRRVCRLNTAPFTRCEVEITGADVGQQALRAVVVDNTGASAQATVQVIVAKFKAELALKVKKKKLSGGRAERVVTGTLVLPDAVTKAQGCSGKVNVTVKRNGKQIIDDVFKVTKNCTFSLSITAPRKEQTFRLSADFGGNTVLRTASANRRFS